LNRFLKFKRLQLVISVSFSLITLFVMAMVGIVLYEKFSSLAERNAVLGNQQIVAQIKINLEQYLEDMTDTFKVVDEKLREHGGVSGAKLEEQLETIIKTRDDIVSIALFNEQGELLTGLPQLDLRHNARLKEQSWYRSAIENPNHLSFSLPHVQNLYRGQYKWVVSMSKGVTIEQNGTAMPAVLLVDFNFKTIDELLRNVSLGQTGYVYVIDESAGNIVYHPQQQLIYAGLKYENVEQALKYTFGSYKDISTGEARLITIQTVNNIGWKIIGISYMNEILTTQKEISAFMVWLLVIVVVMMLLISLYVSSRITQPIKRLERSMKQVERGNFDIQLPHTGNDEVGLLSRRFQFMVMRIRELMDQNIREQEAKRKSELEVLQSQINPHFLYNTLNSVVRMAAAGRSEEVVTTITSLSRFFRISLSRGNHLITVQDELEHVRNYLVIQSVRYRSKFEYQIEAEEEALSCQTVKLILQPIVENAIHHGIEEMVDPGMIRIGVTVDRETVTFVIEDNGLGIHPERLKQLLNHTVASESGSGVGIRNVHERIRLTYGDPYGLSIMSMPEVGTTVTIRIPRRTGEDAA
jgi:two-component system, sensor histidine kinase YesM